MSSIVEKKEMKEAYSLWDGIFFPAIYRVLTTAGIDEVSSHRRKIRMSTEDSAKETLSDVLEWKTSNRRTHKRRLMLTRRVSLLLYDTELDALDNLDVETIEGNGRILKMTRSKCEKNLRDRTARKI